MPVGEGQRVFVMQRLAVGGKEGGGDRRERGGGGEQDSAGYKEPPLAFSHLTSSRYFTHRWRSPEHKGEAMRNTLLRMLAALMCVLAACADITPVNDFDLDKVRVRQMYYHCKTYWLLIADIPKINREKSKEELLVSTVCKLYF